MRNITRRIGVSALVALCIVTSASADPLILGAVKGSSDVNAGVAVIREAYRRLGVDIEIRWLQSSESLDLSNTGVIDGEIQRIDGISRMFENLIQVHVPVNFIQGVVFGRTDSVVVRGWHSLKPYRVGIVKGIVFAEEGTADLPDVKRFDSYEELFTGIRDGLVDVGVMPRVNGILLQRQGIKNVVEIPGVLEHIFLYHYLNKKHADLVPRLTRTLKDMLEDFSTQSLREQVYKGLGN